MEERRVYLPPWPLLPFVEDDGGRALSGFRGWAVACKGRERRFLLDRVDAALDALGGGFAEAVRGATRDALEG